MTITANSLANFRHMIRKHFARIPLIESATPVDTVSCTVATNVQQIAVKHEELSNALYGGNKLRKLEFLLARAIERGARRVATFGTVASNHAVATALYARKAGLETTCFLAPHARTRQAETALRVHLNNGTELVPYGGQRAERIATLRNTLLGRNVWVIPLGGSSWLGTLGFIDAGLELAQQIESGQIARPDRIYVAAGTLGTCAGIALGLALANITTTVHAVRVTAESIANTVTLQRLMRKTALLLNRVVPDVPADLYKRSSIELRQEFFADGYARSNAATEHAVAFAKDHLGLQLESTYTGKAMAALLHDLAGSMPSAGNALFWNTYCPAPMVAIDPATKARRIRELPPAFRSYLQTD